MSMFSEADAALLGAVLDRLIPAVDDLPAAGQMGVFADIAALVTPDDRFGQALVAFLAALRLSTGQDFAHLPGDEQDAALTALEVHQPLMFSRVLEVAYIGYYGRPEVHARIGWRTGPLQPRGFPLPPFDEAILETVRQRTPFWRKA